MSDRVNRYLVTGASGFVAIHLIALLLSRGQKVRGTLRRMEREGELRKALPAYIDADDRLELVSASLDADTGWGEAVEGVNGVFHVASPVPGKIPLVDDHFVEPARCGVLRVLEASRVARVKRVVLTSSVAAITSGHPSREEPFSEKDWAIANLSPPYEKSKTLTEQVAWEWVRTHSDAPELVTVNPSFVLGPPLWSERSPSLDIVQILLDGKQPGVADLYFGLVDVRDVAQAHYLAMTRPEAPGERFLCNTAFLSYRDIALLLADYLAPRGVRIATRRLPNWLVRIVGRFNPSVKFILPRLGQRKALDNTKLREMLDWEPRNIRETLHDTADSLLK